MTPEQRLELIGLSGTPEGLRRKAGAWEEVAPDGITCLMFNDNIGDLALLEHARAFAMRGGRQVLHTFGPAPSYYVSQIAKFETESDGWVDRTEALMAACRLAKEAAK
jgi:hypothetical protein